MNYSRLQNYFGTFEYVSMYYVYIFFFLHTIGQKIKKSPGQKKLVKSDKSISRIFFVTIFHKNYTF